ncbi:hypothetical protein XENTR_v10019119 [Xenopus tropicalis]|uniref:CD5 antigen-like isoform X2 n=1 Tax=Xenopus tropicalis TaxID=8364 RepID=A0A8J0S661_XENTR|nr:CD5 antigen-like isoform X2 [Xenopus tropicalis]KAE8593417.1 hypothetical protein XENTR_v10019119 [Xenopus tropicalis]|eukprot:XP_012809737.1 PREDICTED: CD5 antigen-like isoform X2 [Xenopus tropicalis]
MLISYFPNMRSINCIILDSLNIRLVDGNSSCKGRLEVNHNGTWGTVCNDQWDKKDAKVVCKQLQCGPPKFSYECQPFGEGSGPIWLDEVHCTGKEYSLSECRFSAPGVHDCEHREDVSVMCREPFKIQLVNGSNRCAGRLEVFYDGEWGSVCDDDWDTLDSQVVCNQLRCGDPQLNRERGPRFGQASGRIWLDDVQCNGYESSLEECKHRTWSYHDCTHKEDVSVYCTGTAAQNLMNLQYAALSSSFRGLTPFHSSGTRKIKKRSTSGNENRRV